MPLTTSQTLRALALAALALSTPAAWADTPTTPSIVGDCSATARQAEQRLERRVVGKPYVLVRQQFFAAGWRPAPIQQMNRREILKEPDPPKNDGFGLSEDLYNKRYKEVDMCAGKGEAPCILRFVKKDRSKLRVDTRYDGIPEVTGLQLTCPSNAPAQTK